MITTRSIYRSFSLLLVVCLYGSVACAQKDTLRVMAYNVLYYGDTPPCQGPHSTSHGYLKTIVQYANPDIIGLEKMAAIPTYSGDESGTAPTGFGDSILQFALNAAFTDRYAYCPFTNTSGADNINMLFYDRQKLGYISIISSYSNITDFNTYKLYYKDPSLAITHDTTFLYVTLNHDQSGDDASGTRYDQITGEMSDISTHLSSLPNAINMGDFNTRTTDEPCYQTLVDPDDLGFRYYDPPFYPDGDLSYPADWATDAGPYSAYLTTSTRLSAHDPNSCGTSGGAKAWYDHIFLSSYIINNTRRIKYIPHSYRTLGNDGNRLGISVNDAPENTSAPADVIEALYQMSNKYPVMVSLEVTRESAGVATLAGAASGIVISNPVRSAFSISVAPELTGKHIRMKCMDMYGRIAAESELLVNGSNISLTSSLPPGNYIVRFYHQASLIAQQKIVKE